MRKLSVKTAYGQMNQEAAEIFVVKHGINVVTMDGVDDYLYYLEMPDGLDDDKLMEAANEFFHKICVLEEERDLALEEVSEYCTVHRNEHTGKCFVLFNHPFVIDAAEAGVYAGDTAREFGEAQRKRIEEEEAGEGALPPQLMMDIIAADIKAGKIRARSDDGYFVLGGEPFAAIKSGRKTTEYRDFTPRNLSRALGIKTVRLQNGYGHPGQPPEQMRFEVKSVGLLDADDRECDPYNIPKGFIATTIAIHLGKRIG